MESSTLRTQEKLIEEIGTVLFHSSAIGRIVDDAHDLAPETRRALKAASQRISAEAEALLTWVTEQRVDRPAN